MKDQTHHIKDQRSHHKVSYAIKVLIWIVLSLIAFVPLIFIFGSPRVLLSRTLHYQPLYAYFQWELKSNNLQPKGLVKDLFSSNESAKDKSHYKKHAQNIVNIVYVNATESFHFDQWLFSGDYLSFLINKQNRLIQKKVASKQFIGLYNRLKSRTQTVQHRQQSVRISSKLVRMNEPAFLKFSQHFQKILKNQATLIEQLGQQSLLENIKLKIQKKILQFLSFFDISLKVTRKSVFQQNQVWLIWLFHLKGQSTTDIMRHIKILRKKYPQSKLILFSLHPIHKKSIKTLKYEGLNKKYFQKLFKIYMNTTLAQSKIISSHYEYSTLSLYTDVKDEQEFSMYHLAGGRKGYSDLAQTPVLFRDRIHQICQGNVTKLQKFLQQQQKIQFYRLGLYKLGNHFVWKNKFSKINFQFQTGTHCRRIPIFHNDYRLIFQILYKKYLSPLINIFRVKKLQQSEMKQQIGHQKLVNATQLKDVYNKSIQKITKKREKPKKNQRKK